MKILSRTIEYLKIAAIAVLFCSAVVLAGLYIVRTLDLNQRNEFSLNEMMVTVNDNSEGLKNFDSAYVMPEFIGYKNGEIKHGTFVNEDLLPELFATITPYITNGLGNNYECNALSEEDGTHILKDILDSRFYVYAKFSSELPSSFIYSFCTEKAVVSIKDLAKGPSVGVRDLFIKLISIDGTNYGYEMLVIDSEGSYFIYTPVSESPIYFDVAKINAYDVNTAMQNFDFFCEAETELNHLAVDGLFLLTDGKEKTQIISVENVDSSFFESEENSYLLLDSMGLNTEKMNAYNDGDDLVYIDNHGTVRIGRDGIVSYKASDERSAISLSGFLNYENYSGTYSIIEHALASQSFVESVRKRSGSVFGGEAELKLDRVYFDSENLYVEYGYYFKNVPVYVREEKKLAFKLCMRDGKLIGAELYPLRTYSSQGFIGDFPTIWSLKRLDEGLTEHTYAVPIR
ncbi:MAG: hypothetical protein E7623_06665, partial [Ruminococcaceae bacterium]|nr:hypothetical protein [Oscillospiraceae bacterium]